VPITKEDAQSLCSQTEWNTLVNSFPPKLSELSASVAKKQANRVRRFLTKEEGSDADKKRVSLFSEALDRLAPLLPAKDEDPKATARREKAKAAKDKVKAERDHRAEVREKLIKKAEEEKAEQEGEESTDGKPAGGGKKTGSGLGKSGVRSQGKIGSRKV
jgi:hypothetical protein